MTKSLTALAVLTALVAAAPANAAPPAERIPFSTTVPLASGTYHFRFSLWDANGVSARGAMVWSEEKRIAVRGTRVGAAYRAPLRHSLGSVNPFSASLAPPYPPVDFARQLWVQVAYRAVPTKPWRAVRKRVPLAPAPYALWARGAAAAGDADTVDGLHASELGLQPHTHDGADIAAGVVPEARIDAALARDAEVEAHAERTDNPHRVTAAQAGAAAAAHAHAAGDIASGTLPFGSLPTGTGTDQVAVGSHAHDGAYHGKAHVDALEARIAALEGANASLAARLAALETVAGPLAAILEHFSHAEAGGVHTLVVSGANLQVVDGSGGTDGVTNGMGNLIVGYNASRVPDGGTDARTGSHNLIVGDRNNYASFGGLVAGQENAVLNAYASVSGGRSNTASGENSALSGGWMNSASGPYASVCGGSSNTASGVLAAVVGGGYGNTASGVYATVGGGAGNTASGNYATVGGGSARAAGGEHDWRAGSLFEDQ